MLVIKRVFFLRTILTVLLSSRSQIVHNTMFTPALGLALASLPFALGATFNVQVGAGGKLAYDPEFITANPGDQVNFVLCVFLCTRFWLS